MGDVAQQDRSPPPLHEILAHERAVRAIARRLLGESGADDVVQETWLRAIQQGPRRRRSLRAWLSAVARNVALNILRADQRRTRREQAAARPESQPWTDPLEQRERDRRMIAAVLRLAEPYRSTLLLRFYKGWSLAGIARRSRVSTTAVRKRLQRAFALLRAMLEEAPANTPRPAKDWSLGLPHESPAPG